MRRAVLMFTRRRRIPMRSARIAAALCVLNFGLAAADEPAQLPRDASFTTLIVTPLAIEGLTGDAAGNLYTTGRAAAGTPCPVWRIATSHPTLLQVGSIPNSSGACNPSAITLDAYGNLYEIGRASCRERVQI